eukprot:gnl/MRDRNA2_/MRDRNA2_59957_c0_seq1.p1 gnl/MRDRNA2_/MRDRNA2_59957_c0~~gnl/MRDRNA2_/MRDRNA2_59957_c0_seq1.p1  ORF type:complete len:451 (+),score=71.88 gnl/MRDRNA2_/MRDRNA2_59957_c0_seq1:77-1429(+)
MPLQHDVAQLYLKEDFSDVNFRLETGPPIPAHKFICGTRSEVLKAMFLGPFQEGTANEVMFKDVAREPFLEMLRFLYTDTVELSTSIVVEVNDLAQKYMLPDLQAQCVAFLEQHTDAVNVCGLLSKALSFSNQLLCERCYQYISEQGLEVMESSPGTEMSLAALKMILRKFDEPSFTKVDIPEIHFFNFCVRWADAHGIECKERPQALTDVLPLLRLPLLSDSELATLVPDSGMVTDADLLAVFVHKATNGARPSRFNDQARRILHFVHEHDFDTNGVIYWIGTTARTTTFQNPHATGQVVVSASSDVILHTSLANLVSRDHSYARLRSEPNSWFAIDLREWELRLEKYTLRHGQHAKETVPRGLQSWVLEGSEDGTQWIELDRHTDDTSFHSMMATASWSVTTHDFYQHVRVRMTGPEVSGNFSLHLGGIELYGILRVRRLGTKRRHRG